jgi:hypothetical protein
MARDDPEMPPLKLQLLVVPAVDARYIPLDGSCEKGACPYETYYSCEYAPCLPLSRMRWFSRLWIGTDLGKCFIYSILLFADQISSTLKICKFMARVTYHSRIAQESGTSSYPLRRMGRAEV